MELSQDHQGIAWGHWLAQFDDKTAVEALVKALLQPSNSINKALQDLIGRRWLDTAEGKQLDGIGEIVGLSRSLVEYLPVTYFGFLHQPNIGGFHAARIKRKHESLVTSSAYVLPDQEYRTMLYWKIGINNGHGTTEEIIRSIEQVFGATQVVVTNAGGAHLHILISGIADANHPLLNRLVEFVPRAAGVGLSVDVGGLETFGFEEFGFAGFDVGVIARTLL